MTPIEYQVLLPLDRAAIFVCENETDVNFTLIDRDEIGEKIGECLISHVAPSILEVVGHRFEFRRLEGDSFGQYYAIYRCV